MTAIEQHLIDAISLGSLYALLGLGIALVFGIMRLINFAHGELIMTSAYAATLVSHATWPIVIATMLLVPVIFALAMERLAFRPVRGAPESTMLVTSFAVSYLLQNLATLIFSATPRSINLSTLLDQSFNTHGLVVPKLDIASVGASLLLLVLLGLFLARTSLGVQMRAAAEDFTMARILGVNANRVIASAFAISGLLAGAAGYLIVEQSGSVYPTMGLNDILTAFVATILGGMGSLSGAVLGGYGLALVTVALDAYLPVGLRDYEQAFAYLAVIGVLVFRPQGLLVPRSARTRV